MYENDNKKLYNMWDEVFRVFKIHFKNTTLDYIKLNILCTLWLLPLLLFLHLFCYCSKEQLLFWSIVGWNRVVKYTSVNEQKLTQIIHCTNLNTMSFFILNTSLLFRCQFLEIQRNERMNILGAKFWKPFQIALHLAEIIVSYSQLKVSLFLI